MYQDRENIISLSEAASILDVSSATVRNWIKHDYIKPVHKSRSFMFDSHEINNLKFNIKNGKINRLNTRANKINAKRKFIPEEYVNNRIDRNTINNIINYIDKYEIEISRALFLLSLNILNKKKIVKNLNIDKYIIIELKNFNNRQLFFEMYSWYSALNNFKIDKDLINLLKVRIPEQEDLLGLIYQSIMFEGDKSNRGSYYTPKKIVKDISELTDSTDKKILDPCCGTGQFLLTFSEKIKDPNNLYGFDIDETAIRIARINILIQYYHVTFNPNIFHQDTLNIINCKYDYKKMEFDIIATNPPWGLHYSKDEKEKLENKYPGITSFESYSYILKKSIEMLKNKGKIFFILPESILNIRIHKDIRKYILQHTQIDKILYLDRIFKNVFTPVIRLDLIKKKTKNNGLLIYKNNRTYKLDQNKFLDNQDYIFNINANQKDQDILKKIHNSKHITLKGNASWVLGIVTGNNKKYISTKKNPGYEEIITGKEIGKFQILKSTKYIKFNPEKFQQCAPENRYRVKEKLVYKFISKKLVFAYDNKQRLTLNSANILIPNVKGYPIKVIMALFNSSLYQYIFQKKFSTIKILKNHLEQLPLPLWDKMTFDIISRLVDKIHDNDKYFQQLDHIIMEKFILNRKEIKIILDD